jgi:membrane-anchored protein YejM (alkaline phosphatase superfamily)
MGLFLSFLWHYQGYTFTSLLLSILAAISSATILYLLFYIILLPFAWSKKWVLYLSALLFIVADIALIIDFFIYKLFHFHINAMVLNILTSPDAMDSIQTGVLPLILAIVLLFLFIWLELKLLKNIQNRPLAIKRIQHTKHNKYILMTLLFIILIEKISFGMASLYSKNEYIIPFKVIPLYQPLTFNKIAAKYFGFTAEKQAQFSIKTTSDLNYPLTPLKLDNKAIDFNIFIIASDSLKYDAINIDNTPNIMHFAKDALTFEHHYSGGNSTRFGIFSLIYGLNATYWFSFLNSNQKPLLFDILKKQAFDINIISSTNTNWPEFRKTCYVDVQKHIKDDFKGSPWQKDAQSTKHFIKQVSDKNITQHRFSFIFLDSPHGYDYPPEENKYQASDDEVNYLAITEGSSELHTIEKRYKNAVYYNDILFGKMIQALKDNDLYDNALILYTSDHGQEFYEQGNFGHNTAFSNGQIHIPLLIKLPKSLQNLSQSAAIHKLTSHQDIAPTLLSLLGVTNPTSTYSNGFNLLSKDFNRDYIFCANWNSNAILTNETVSIFSNKPNKIFNNEVREQPSYKKINQKSKSTLLLDVIKENKKFLK